MQHGGCVTTGVTFWSAEISQWGRCTAYCPGESIMLLFREHPETTCKEEILTTLLRGEELAFLTLDYIREHPEEWDQESYFGGCDTTACFAGRAILLALGADWRSSHAECSRKNFFHPTLTPGISPESFSGGVTGKL